MPKEIATQEINNPMQIISAAVSNGAQVSDMKELFEMHKEWERNEATKAYNAAMANAQANMPAILKTKINRQTNSRYADLGDIIKLIKPVYTDNGFSLSFNEGKADIDTEIRVIGICSHKAGHSETFFTDLPVDDAGIKGNVNKTGVHGKASTISYGQRYLTKMIFNLALDEEDDDAQTSGGRAYKKMYNEEGITKACETYGHAWYKHADVISTMKDQLADDNLLGAAEALYSLPNTEHQYLFRAATKGGIFTLEETKKMSKTSPEWNDAIKEAVKLNPEVDRSI